MNKNQIIGIASASKILGWKVSRFASLYYDKRVPEPTIIDNRPVWQSEVLLNWRDNTVFAKRGRPRKL